MATKASQLLPRMYRYQTWRHNSPSLRRRCSAHGDFFSLTVAILQVLNKVAGIYGLIAVFTGGSFAQVSMYLYSVIMLLALAWALKAVAEVSGVRFA